MDRVLHHRYQMIQSLNQDESTLLALDTHRSPSVSCVLQRMQSSKTEAIVPLLETISTHPKVPTLLDWFETEGQIYLVWEFIAGKTLEARLAEVGRFTIAEIVQLLADILPALEVLHRYGLIHSTLNPNHVIYTNQQRFVLVNLSQVQLSSAIATLPSGDPEYAAPEQLQGKAVYASDLYSLGVICLHLLTDLRPFDLLDPIEHRWIWRTYWRLNESGELREHLADFLEQLAAFQLEQRFSSAETALLQLQAFQPKQTSQPHSLESESTNQSNQQEISAIACLSGHTGLRTRVTTVALSPDAQLVASGSDDKTVRLWQVATGQSLGKLNHDSTVNAISFSPDGQTLASGSDRTICLWNVATQQVIANLTAHRQTVTTLQFHPDGQLLASGSSDKTVKLWSLQTQTLKTTFTGHRLAITAVAFSPILPILATASLDSTVRLWDLNTFEQIACLQNHTRAVRALCFSQSSHSLATGGDDNVIYLWDIQKQDIIAKFSGHAWAVTGLAFLPDGVTLASAGWDKTIKLWQVKTNEVTVLSGHTDSIYAIAVAPTDSHVLIASGSQDQTVRLWQVSKLESFRKKEMG